MKFIVSGPLCVISGAIRNVCPGMPRLDEIRYLPDNSTVQRVSNGNIQREFLRGLRMLGGALAIHRAAETIEYLPAAHLLSKF